MMPLILRRVSDTLPSSISGWTFVLNCRVKAYPNVKLSASADVPKPAASVRGAAPVAPASMPISIGS